MMQELFDSMAAVERGEKEAKRQLKRRCNDDILVRFECKAANCGRFYSSQPSLQRHVRIKHRSALNEPP
jgi:hypothetical protein